MYFKTFENFSQKSGIIESSKLFVIKQKDDTSVHKLYFKEEEAKKACDEFNESMYNHYRKTHRDMTDLEFEKYMNDQHKGYKSYVVDLDDAIYEIKDYSENRHRFEDYMDY